MTLREKIEVMQAFERGEEIEYTPLMEEIWRGTTIPAWDWDWALYEYRIKPKPKQVVVIEKWLIYDNLSKSYFINLILPNIQWFVKSI